MPSIYDDILELEKELDNCFDLETGEIDEEKEQIFLSKINERLENGLEFLCKSRANKLNLAAGLKDEEVRIIQKRKTLENKITSLENYILAIFKKANKTKVEAGTFTISTRKSTQVIVSDDFNNPEYIKYEPKIDKKKLKDALVKEEIAGAYLQNKENLVVK